MDRKILVIVFLALATLPLSCSAAEEQDSFFNADDVMCPGGNMEIGGCSIEFDGTVACKWEENNLVGPTLRYNIYHFTEKEAARKEFQERAYVIQEQYEIGIGSLPDYHKEIRQYDSLENSIVYERMTQYYGPGWKGTGPAKNPPDYRISSANNYRDTIVIDIMLGDYPSEERFNADKARVYSCIASALERKIPGITSGAATAVQAPARQSQQASAQEAEKNPLGQRGSPARLPGSSPVSDTLGSVESILHGGVTPLGEEMLNGLNNIIGDLTGDKPVPTEVEDALAQAGIDCNERDQITRDRCFSDAALESKNPLVCIKMHTGLEQIRKCSDDVFRQSMNPGICENLPAFGKMYDMTSERCFSGLFQNAPDISFCNNLDSQKKTECLSVLKGKNGSGAAPSI